jgi:uncharacterized membrane protein YhhN
MAGIQAIDGLVLLAILLAVLEWVAVEKRWRRLEYIFKPGVMVFLAAWLILSGSRGQINLAWFTLGAVFSLLGDAFLLLPRERLGFMLGLVFFFLAQASYIVALNIPWLTPGLIQWLAAALVLVFGIWIGIKLVVGLHRRGSRWLIFPVCIYLFTLMLMLGSALGLAFRPGWKVVPALMVALGAGLFSASDTLLAWNKFVRPVRHGRLVLMVLYHLGQVFILVGALMQFNRY